MSALSTPTMHGGVLVPLDPFRVSHLAADEASADTSTGVAQTPSMWLVVRTISLSGAWKSTKVATARRPSGEPASLTPEESPVGSLIATPADQVAPWSVLVAPVARDCSPSLLTQTLVRFFPSAELLTCGLDPLRAAGEMSIGSRHVPSEWAGPPAATASIPAISAVPSRTLIGSE